MKPEIVEGSVVISQKGRDKGRPFVVLYYVDACFVMIADGGTRPLAKPKKKRCKHLRACPAHLTEILESYRQGQLKDSDLRKALYPYKPQDGANILGREKPFVEG